MSKKYALRNLQFDTEEEELGNSYRSKKEKRQRTITKAKKKFAKRREDYDY